MGRVESLCDKEFDPKQFLEGCKLGGERGSIAAKRADVVDMETRLLEFAPDVYLKFVSHAQLIEAQAKDGSVRCAAAAAKVCARHG